MRRPSPADSRSAARSSVEASGAMRSRLATLLAQPPRPRLGEIPLEHLAGRVARQLGQEHDLARHLEACEVALDVVLDRGLVEARAVQRHDERLQALAEL